MSSSTIAAEVASLIEESSGGTVSQVDALDSSTTLAEKGFSSLAFLQLVDAIEISLGVFIDLEQDTEFLRTVDGIVAYIGGQRGL